MKPTPDHGNSLPEEKDPNISDLPGELFVAGIGASAGGLEALSELLKGVTPGAALALLVVQHLDPEHESILVELLNRVSLLPVRWAKNGEAIEAGHVYVAPPRASMSMKSGRMVLGDDGRRPSGAINHLFRSLAEEGRDRAIGVILSGNGEDGTLGLREIKDLGGIVFAQELSTATFPSMPRAAIAAGCVDRVLPAAGIAAELIKFTQSSHTLWERIGAADDGVVPEVESRDLASIFRLLAARTGVDFSDYKQSTIRRRLVRRMILAKTPGLGDYVKLLQKSREEAGLLFEGLLINVTEFFRDAESFDFLQASIIPEIVARHADHSPIRVWVPGCSTGEEAYALAIVLREQLEAAGGDAPVQIFGTDVSDHVISIARAGVYSTAQMAGVGEDRLHRFFHETDRGYMVQKSLRDMCVFARQDVAKDSPFSRLDLISCRNLLIYLNAKLQRKLMPIFHYALNPHGYLVLGTSESVGGHAELFRLVDRKHRVYSRKSGARLTRFEFSVDHVPPGTPVALKPLPTMADDQKESFDVIREADRIVLGRHGPTGVLINNELEILQFRGDVTPYLAPGEGRASLNLVKMAREGLAGELQSVVKQARDKNIRVERTGIIVMEGNITRRIDLDVTPIETARSSERHFLILFRPSGSEAPGTPLTRRTKPVAKSVQAAQIEHLRQDLQATRNYLQATIEKHESTNQELRAANEEIQSSNEELQSTNEELETAKEELQSTNEELTTVNEELHSRQLELIHVNNDLNNLINSVHLPIIILGQDMRIRRFTPMAEKVLNVIPSDIGRPLSDININLNIQNLPRLIIEVVDSLTIKELEVQDGRHHWYSMRLRPYKTSENKIDGVVITLIDIDEMKRTIAALEEARDFGQAVIESTHEPMAVLDAALRIKTANDSFHRLFRSTREQTRDKSVFGFVGNANGLEEFRTKLEGIFPNGGSLTDHELRMDLGGSGLVRLSITARQISSGARSYPLLLASFRRLS